MHLDLCQSECIVLKKVPPTSGSPLTRIFTKKEHPRLVTKINPLHCYKHHIMWCMYNSVQCKFGNKMATDQKTHKKPSIVSSTREHAVDAMIDIFGNNNKSSDEE